jgi:hypothetical protein
LVLGLALLRRRSRVARRWSTAHSMGSRAGLGV